MRRGDETVRRVLAILLSLLLLVQSLPAAGAIAQTPGDDIFPPPLPTADPLGPPTAEGLRPREAQPRTASVPVPPPDVLTVPPLERVHGPGLTLRLAVSPDRLVVGETATVSVTVVNQSLDPAVDLAVTLDRPAGAAPLPGAGLEAVAGRWRWTAARLDGHASATFAASLRLDQVPAGGALVVRARATADGLPQPVLAEGGALVGEALPGRAQARFTPGQAAALRSPDGRVQVHLPAGAASRPLSLTYSAAGVGAAGPTAPLTPTATATPDAIAPTASPAATLAASPTATASQPAAPAGTSTGAPTSTATVTAAPATATATATAVGAGAPVAATPTPTAPAGLGALQVGTPSPTPTATAAAPASPTAAPVPPTATSTPPSLPPATSPGGPTATATSAPPVTAAPTPIPTATATLPTTPTATATATILPAALSPSPPGIAGFKRGLGIFFLEATDDAGQPVRQFDAPLTITVQYTAAQLTARGLAEVDLALFWYDEQAVVAYPDGSTGLGTWVPLPTTIDPAAGTASAAVDHFTAFQLGDGSSPSEAYLPSLQGWQTDSFTGAAAYSLPLELPAGPGGSGPRLALSYSSAATDGKSGQRAKQQAGWAGKGWSLDTGSIALHKIGATGTAYTAVFNGRSFTLVRGAVLPGKSDDGKPDSYDWRTSDESFIKVRAAQNGAATTARGGLKNGVPYTRYRWTVWERGGTRYEFDEDLWWGWDGCEISGQPTYMETYKWNLSRVVDTHGNTTAYEYGRFSEYRDFACANGSNRIQGTMDYDAWPTNIYWGANPSAGAPDYRYRVELVSSARTNDTQFEGADNHIGGQNGAPRETRRLDAVSVASNSSSGAPNWSLVRQYRLTYDYSLLSDVSLPNGDGTYRAETGYPKLTLTSLTRVGSDNTTALPVMSFSYGTERGTGFFPAGNWNRLVFADNAHGGGRATFAYETVWNSSGGNNAARRNWRRVTTRYLADGRGSTQAWSYAYQRPALNWLGTNGGSAHATEPYPNSARLYLAHTWTAGNTSDNIAYLQTKQYDEFRGHSQVTETAPDGGRTVTWFDQGDVGCTPAVQAANTTSYNGDACFVSLRDREFRRGQAWKVERQAASGAVLETTETSQTVDFYDYTSEPRAGIWRGWARVTETNQYAVEGECCSTRRRTVYQHDPSNQAGVQAGNVTKTIEYEDSGEAVRSSERWFARRDDAGGYLVDRLSGENVRDKYGNYLADTNYLYDGRTTSLELGAAGDLTLVRRYHDVPLQTSLEGVTLRSADTSYGYDAYGNRTTATTYADYGSRSTSGNVHTYSAPGSGSTARTTTTTYDSLFHTFPVRVDPPTVNGVTLTETAEYDLRMGRLTRVTDANGQSTSAGYDVFGRQTALVRPGDSSAYPTVQSDWYDRELPVKQVVRRRETAGTDAYQTSVQFFDGLGRTIQTKRESAAGTQTIVTDTGYDGVGRVSQQSQPRYVSETSGSFLAYQAPGSAAAMRWTTSRYDALGRVLDVTLPDGSTTTTRYRRSGPGREATVTDANGHRTRRVTDLFGRLVTVAEDSGNGGSEGGYATYATTTYEYSPLDLLTRVTDAQGNLTTMTYDSLGRKRTMVDPDLRGTWVYTYDPQGNLLQQYDAKNQTIQFAYDALDRLTTTTYPDGSQALVRYDEAREPNGRGRRTSMQRGSDLSWWRYDERGRVTRAYHDVAGQSSTRGVGWSYDSADRLTSITYPTGETVSYTYDAAWRQSSLCSSYGGCYVTTATYTALDQPYDRTFANGHTQNHRYTSPLARLEVIQVGAASLFERRYTYDAVGNVQTITDPNPAASQTQSFSYDHRDRLTRGVTSGATTGAYDERYTYDTIGNLTSKGGTSYSYAGSGHAHAPASVGGSSYTYDDNGNLLSGGGRTITWNAANQPTRIVSGNGVTQDYTYHADGSRLTVTTSGLGTTLYLNGLWEEDLWRDYRRSLYYLNGQLIGQRENTTLLFLSGDHLGSVSLVTDHTGATVSRQDFAPFGTVRSGGVGQTTLNFTGQHRDSTGLLFYNARYYDPAIGKFLSPDTIVPGTASGTGGGAATLGYDDRVALAPLTVAFHEPDFLAGLNAEHRFTQANGFWFQLSAGEQRQAKVQWGPANPQALNRYAYVLNNPVRYTDPTGHFAEAAAAGLALLFGAAGITVSAAFIAGVVAAVGAGVIVGCLATDWCREAVWDEILAFRATGNANLDIAIFSSNLGLSLGYTWQARGRYGNDPRTAGQIINDEKQAHINREFPDEWRDKTYSEIDRAASRGDARARKARKLLTSREYDKRNRR